MLISVLTTKIAPGLYKYFKLNYIFIKTTKKDNYGHYILNNILLLIINLYMTIKHLAN